MDIGEKVTLLRDTYSEGNNMKFAELMGETPATTSGWCRAKSLGREVIVKILSNLPDVDANWLMMDNGPMLKVEMLKEKPIKGSIPFYEHLPVSAGNLDVLIKSSEPTGWLNLPGVSAKALFPVIGCSMKPEINPGDMIGVVPLDAWDMVDPDKVYFIITSDDRMIKHLAVDDIDEDILWCISPNYPKFKICKSDIKFIYRVSFCGKLM